MNSINPINRTIIGIFGTADVGKSMTLARLGRQIRSVGGVTDDNIEGDNYRAIFSYQNMTIGVQTYGDTEHLVGEGLEHFLQQHCDIIAIASKRYGRTVDHIGWFAGRQGYRIIWAAPYEVKDDSINTDVVKSYSASHLLLMIDDILAAVI